MEEEDKVKIIAVVGDSEFVSSKTPSEAGTILYLEGESLEIGFKLSGPIENDVTIHPFEYYGTVFNSDDLSIVSISDTDIVFTSENWSDVQFVEWTRDEHEDDSVHNRLVMLAGIKEGEDQVEVFNDNWRFPVVKGGEDRYLFSFVSHLVEYDNTLDYVNILNPSTGEYLEERTDSESSVVRVNNRNATYSVRDAYFSDSTHGDGDVDYSYIDSKGLDVYSYRRGQQHVDGEVVDYKDDVRYRVNGNATVFYRSRSYDEGTPGFTRQTHSSEASIRITERYNQETDDSNGYSIVFTKQNYPPDGVSSQYSSAIKLKHDAVEITSEGDDAKVTFNGKELATKSDVETKIEMLEQQIEELMNKDTTNTLKVKKINFTSLTQGSDNSRMDGYLSRRFYPPAGKSWSINSIEVILKGLDIDNGYRINLLAPITPPINTINRYFQIGETIEFPGVSLNGTGIQRLSIEPHKSYVPTSLLVEAGPALIHEFTQEELDYYKQESHIMISYFEFDSDVTVEEVVDNGLMDQSPVFLSEQLAGKTFAGDNDAVTFMDRGDRFIRVNALRDDDGDNCYDVWYSINGGLANVGSSDSLSEGADFISFQQTTQGVRYDLNEDGTLTYTELDSSVTSSHILTEVNEDDVVLTLEYNSVVKACIE